MSVTEIPRLLASATPAEVVAALTEVGAVIVERAVDRAVCEAVRAEVAPYLEVTAPGREDLGGRRTRRMGSLIARSPSSHLLATHPTVLGTCDAVLGANSSSYQLHLTQVIDIGPDEPAQYLHRDQWAWDQFPFPHGFEVEISTIWAIDEFTELNGATRVVPGSHRWTDRKPEPGDTLPAEMPAGSVLIYTGSVFHGGGANRSDRARTAVNIDYCLGWLRQEENQYLSCPPDAAAQLPVELARLIGYSRAAFALGYFGDTQDPIEAIPGAAAGSRGFADVGSAQ